MVQEDAKKAIIEEWRKWITGKNKGNPTGTDALMFFGFLQKERDYLFLFKASGDKWQVVHGWLQRAGLVSN
jgi:hypothetical protein